jgi:hypothetical protein
MATRLLQDVTDRFCSGVFHDREWIAESLQRLKTAHKNTARNDSQVLSGR